MPSHGVWIDSDKIYWEGGLLPVGNDWTPHIKVRLDGWTSSLWVGPDTGPEVPAGPIAGP